MIYIDHYAKKQSWPVREYPLLARIVSVRFDLTLFSVELFVQFESVIDNLALFAPLGSCLNVQPSRPFRQEENGLLLPLRLAPLGKFFFRHNLWRSRGYWLWCRGGCLRQWSFLSSPNRAATTQDPCLCSFLQRISYLLFVICHRIMLLPPASALLRRSPQWLYSLQRFLREGYIRTLSYRRTGFCSTARQCGFPAGPALQMCF